MLRYPGGSYGDIPGSTGPVARAPTSHRGADLPGNWPDSVVAAGRPDWNNGSPNSTGQVSYAGFTPASGGTVDKYEVYRRSGTDSELLGTSTPVTFTTSTPSPVSSDWNGTWSENGQAVTVTNLSWDGTLAADGGNTVDIGFAGANDGAYPSPAAFSLNGTVCATTYSS